jgi:putative sterol carrier protein
MEFTGPGGGAFTIQVADGSCQVTEGETRAHPDLVMTQSPVTFVKTMNKMHNPMLALMTGKMKVRGMRQMGTFAKLFPPLDDLNTVLETPVENRTAPGAPALGSVA